MDSGTAMAVLFRWLHITSGVFWIGLLYYFNVVQVPVFKKFDAATRSLAIQKLVPVALAWFRYSALSTVLFGLLVLWAQDQTNSAYMSTERGMIISSGMLLGLVMAFNVWALIWPNQRKIIEANRAKAATGKDIPPESAHWAKTAFYASRTNFVLSFPMLFFMVSAPHPIGTANETLGVGAAILVLTLVALWIFTSMKPAAQKTGGTTPATKP